MAVEGTNRFVLAELSGDKMKIESVTMETWDFSPRSEQGKYMIKKILDGPKVKIMEGGRVSDF